MTEFLVFLGFLALVIGAWAPARIDALRSGRSYWDSRNYTHEDAHVRAARGVTLR